MPASGAIELIVATRIHSRSSSAPLSVAALREFICCALQYADVVAIACDQKAHEDQLLGDVKQIVAEWDARVHTVVVSHWGQFVPALNALLTHAAKVKAKHILFQSVECMCAATLVQQLLSHMDEDTLVAGAAFPNQHAFTPDSDVVLDGLTSPWNTMAVWSVPKLSRTGFLLVSEGLIDGIAGGVEEVAVIAVHQAMAPASAKAKLVQPAQQLTWSTDFSDPARMAWHKEKMASKRERAAAQLAALGVASGVVTHICAARQS